MTAIGAMMEPGAGGVDRAMLVGRPDAAGGHSDTSGGMTWKAAEVVVRAVYGTKSISRPCAPAQRACFLLIDFGTTSTCANMPSDRGTHPVGAWPSTMLLGAVPSRRECARRRAVGPRRWLSVRTRTRPRVVRDWSEEGLGDVRTLSEIPITSDVIRKGKGLRKAKG